MDVPLLLALWLHTVALVIAWGYYGVLGRIVLPALGTSLDLEARARTVATVERRALPLVLVAAVVFTVTGTYLLVVNPDYTGVGAFFASTWSTLMAVKHVLVVGFVVLVVVVDRSIRRAASTSTDPAAELGRARLAAEAATALGALIVLLTAAAQLAA